MYCMEQGKCKTVFLSMFSRLIAPGDSSTIFSFPIKLKKSNFALVKLRGSFEKLLLSSVSDVILVVVVHIFYEYLIFWIFYYVDNIDEFPPVRANLFLKSVVICQTLETS